MSSFIDIDQYYLNCIKSLHAIQRATNQQQSALQLSLEKAIKDRTGVTKDCKGAVASLSNTPLPLKEAPIEKAEAVAPCIEEIKTESSSDNELELDLFNDEFSCIICSGMDVAAGNCLIECSVCHSLYHQKCHRPPTLIDFEINWVCQNCSVAASALQNAPSVSSSQVFFTQNVGNVSQKTESRPRVQVSSAISLPHFSLSQFRSGCIPNTKAMHKACSSGSFKYSMTANFKMTAEKRLQLMKKKAAKLHEKRKQMPR